MTTRPVAASSRSSVAGPAALALVAFLAGLVPGGCASQARKVELPVEAPDAFSASGGEAVPERWWTAFGDEGLNAAVEHALGSNLDLKTAWQRLRSARAVVDRESSALLPDLQGTVQALTGRTQSEFAETEDIRLGLSSEYEVDLWGRIDSAIDAERLRARATLEDYRTAALSLSAEIVRTWVQLAEARHELRLVQRQIETNEQVEDLLENRFGTGLIRAVDILRQRQLVESTREQKTLVESRIRILEHQLAVLMGRPPQEGVESLTGGLPDSLPELPPLPDTGVPVELVRRRPDVRSAFHRVQAADRDLAVAISSQYPRLNLSASADLAADDAGVLFRDWAVSFVGDLLAPIFLGGQLRAEVDRVEAVKRQRLHQYGQAVLTAFREVEDALVLETKQAESIDSLERQVELGEKAYEQLRVQFFHGTSDYLDVLTALDDLQQLRRDLLAARLTLVEFRITLYRALAGPFETPRERQSVKNAEATETSMKEQGANR